MERRGCGHFEITDWLLAGSEAIQGENQPVGREVTATWCWRGDQAVSAGWPTCVADLANSSAFLLSSEGRWR